MDIIDNFIAPPCKDLVQVLYQDEAILLINKPSGLLSLSGKNPLNRDSVHYRLVNGRLVDGQLHGQPGLSPAFAEAKLPHRLDFGTSGIMLVALTKHATAQLNKQFQAGTVQKRYTAMLEGWVSADEGLITAPVAKDKNQFPLVKICYSSGKAASSQFKVLDRLSEPKRSLVQFTPLSGRTHQLRIHSLSIGHPILGCDLYHSATSQQLAKRLLLHASDIYFQHPLTGEPCHGHCASPF